MAYRLLAKFEEQTVRVSLHHGRNVIGSDPSCEICLRHPTVSRRHAVVMVSAAEVELEDLGSTNGTMLRSQRVERTRIEAGDIFLIGRVMVLLEEISEEDLEIGIGLPPGVARVREGDEEPAVKATEAFTPIDRFALDHLPRLLDRLRQGADRERLAQLAGFALSDTLPAASVEVIEIGEGGEVGVLYAAEHTEGDEEAVDKLPWTEVALGANQLRVRFLSPKLATHYRPLVDSAALLLALAEEGSERQAPPPPRPEPGERPQPPSVEPAMQQIYDQAERVARGDVGVMIYGESGTGKEVLARFIHSSSPRAEKPLVAINCASLPRDLLEAELFGVEKGVATGVEERPGKFEAANEGAIFLDEIGDMAPETQAKILRVIQEQEVFRVGGHTPRPARARVIAATHRSISKMIAEGTFRSDLYHRIATWEVELPPLRLRRADIPNLAVHFLAREAQGLGIQVRGISRAALTLLQRYRWPGNIRQLRNEISRAVLFLEDGELLDTSRLSPGIRGASEVGGGDSLAQILESVEREEITAVLEACDGDTQIAADRLQLSRPTLYRRIKNLGIQVGKKSG